MREVTIQEWFGPSRLVLEADNTPGNLLQGPVRASKLAVEKRQHHFLLYPVTHTTSAEQLTQWRALEAASHASGCLSSIDHIPDAEQTLLPMMLCKQTGELFSPPCPGCGDHLHWIPTGLEDLAGSREDSLYCPHCFNSGESEDWRVFVTGDVNPANARELSLFEMWSSKEQSKHLLPCSQCEQSAQCYSRIDNFRQELVLVLNNACEVYIAGLEGMPVSQWQQQVDADIDAESANAALKAQDRFKARLSLFRQWLAALDALQQNDALVNPDVNNMYAFVDADPLIGDACWRSRLSWFPGTGSRSGGQVSSAQYDFVFDDISEAAGTVTVQGRIKAEVNAETLLVTLGDTEGFHEPLTFVCELGAVTNSETSFKAELFSLPQPVLTSLNVLRHIPELALSVETGSDGEPAQILPLALSALIACFESCGQHVETSIDSITQWLHGGVSTDMPLHDFITLACEQGLPEQLQIALPFTGDMLKNEPALAVAYLMLVAEIGQGIVGDGTVDNIYAQLNDESIVEHLMTETEMLWSELVTGDASDQNEVPAEPAAIPVTFHQSPPQVKIESPVAPATMPDTRDVDEVVLNILQDYIDDPSWLSRFFTTTSRPAISEQNSVRTEVTREVNQSRVDVSAERAIPENFLSGATAGLDETIILDPEMMNNSAAKPAVDIPVSDYKGPEIASEGLDETIILGGDSPYNVEMPVARPPAQVSQNKPNAQAEPGIGLDETIVLQRDDY